MSPVIISIIKNKISAIFDEDHYLSQCRETNFGDLSPIEHYITVGWKQKINPCKEFSVEDYIKENPSVISKDIEPLYHCLITAGKYNKKNTTNQSLNGVKDDIKKLIETVSAYFDAEFYFIQTQNRDFGDPVLHYVTQGWKQLLDPHPEFSVAFYLNNNPDVAAGGFEPYFHWIATGRHADRPTSRSFFPAKAYTDSEKLVAPYFDCHFYLKSYPDVAKSKYNPLIHYMRSGWREGRNPTASFKTGDYLLSHPEVVFSGQNPFAHYIANYPGRPNIFNEVATVKRYLGEKIFHAYQDITFPNRVSYAEKVMIFILPEHNEMSGGIFSIFSIAGVVKRTKYRHGYEVLLMTRPNTLDATYCRQTNFLNTEDVYRFAQLDRLTKIKELFLNIPEYASKDFISSLSQETLDFLKRIPMVYVNIMNQNITLMPERHAFDDLRVLSRGNISQTVAHHAYFTQYHATKYWLPTSLLPAYTDLSGYSPTTYKEKSDIIIYSPDDAPHKVACLAQIRNKLPRFSLIEIKKITFEDFMELATTCKYSISFGEGFDGYIAQPVLQGGLGLTVFREDFFPSADYLNYDLFFASQEDMINNICDVIMKYESNPVEYASTNNELVGRYRSLYDFNDYCEKVSKLVGREFDFTPGGGDPGAITKSFRRE
jgi:hypothetical protein